MICDITKILEASPSQIFTNRSTVWKFEENGLFIFYHLYDLIYVLVGSLNVTLIL